MRLTEPPRFIERDAQADREEIQRLRRMTPDERLAELAALCRARAKLLSMNGRREFVLKYKEPLPESTVKAFARLHRRYLVAPP